ncbi:MFS transporter [Kibdelosporangium phytohabitans]|uniref:MFS transporter n=1 Tax=Kibdelosporangium phytohabitans TaxID=860235 RepID=UPI0007C84906|nr:MFS transporter [Kibdelosporangium phytohabitans]MBE1461823.1 MFS family permease [Kibdelosporangium phytohabitans]
MMVGLDGTALTIAGPDIAQSVGASMPELQWIANAYLLTLALALFPAGRAADRLGRRTVFLAGVLGFGVVSLLIALTTSSWLLILLRGAQGVCGAMLQPAALALLRAAFPRDRLELALGIWGGASAVSIAGGPILGGTIVEHHGWPVVFLINLPVAVLTAGLTLWATRESKATDRPGSVRALVRTPGVPLGAVLIGLSYFSLFGLLFFLTLYLQNVRDFTPVRAGEWLLPLTAVIVLSAPIGGALTGRFGPKWPAVGGLALISAGLLGFRTLDTTSGAATLLPYSLVLGTGTGIALIAATQIVVAGAPERMSGLASALQQAATQVGGVLGILTLGLVMSWHVPPGAPDPDGVTQGLGDPAVFLAGFHASALVAAVVVAIGAVLALCVSGKPCARVESPLAEPQPAGPPDPAADVQRESRYQ